MSGLGWKLRRLRAMSAAEVLHRARLALRDRWARPAWESMAPAEAFGALFEADAGGALADGRHAAWLPGRPEARELAAARAEAEGLAHGRWRLFGHEVTLADPPPWSANLLTGERWPEAPSDELDHRRHDVAGGVKYVWELGRLTMLPSLALASHGPTGGPHGERLARWLDDFTARNPLGHGIQHTSGLELAVRVLTVNAAFALADRDAARPRLEPALGLLAQQALWCRDHLSLGSSANNHLLAEYAAMAVMGALHPSLGGAEALARGGLEGLCREIPRQFHDDGASAEQSFGYLPFIWELVLLALRAVEATGHAVPAPVRERLARSLEFARVMRLPDGRLPQVGDEDDGRVLLAADGRARHDLVGNALAAWLGVDALADDAAGYAVLLTGRPPGPARAAADGRHAFGSGGYTVWREGGQLVTFDHGPLGLGSIAAHGHADALAVTLWRGVDGLVVDPGTFSYQEDPPARDRCRATPAHATLHFGGRSQSEMLGPFLWGRRGRLEREGAGWACTWWTGERHARTVEVWPGRVEIADRARGDAPTLVFPLAPGAAAELDGARAVVRSGASAARFECVGGAGWRLEPSEHAPRYGLRVGASRLVMPLTGPEARTTIEIGPA